jgi:predicted nucleic acid-binding protein
LIVVDTNIIVYFLWASRESGEVEEVMRRDAEWIAPRLWRSEFRNVLTQHVRHGTFTLATAQRLMSSAEKVMRNGEVEALSSYVFSLALASGCTAYDCEFVAVAQTLGVPLMTGDRAILRGFPAIALTPADFLARHNGSGAGGPSQPQP